MEVNFRKATIEDCFYFEVHMRDADKAEARCISVKAYGDILVDCLTFSHESHVAFFPGEKPFAMFGVGRSSALGDAVPWLVATNDIMKCKKFFYKTAVRVLAAWLDCYGRMWNIVHEDNVLAVFFLKRLGFKFGEKSRGLGKAVMIEFYMDKEKS